MPDRPDPLAALHDLEGVASAMAATRDGIDALLRDRGLRRTAPTMTGESLLRGAHASAVLAGAVCSLEDIRSGSAPEEAMPAVRVSAELMGLAPRLAASPLQAFARLHTLAGSGVVPDDELGRPHNPHAARRLSQLGRLLTEATRAPALVVAAVAHAELVAAAPFASGNGIVARAVERLILVGRGVDPTSLVVPEAGHLALRREYESNLLAYSEGGTRGVQAWLLYAAEAFAAGAEASPLRAT